MQYVWPVKAATEKEYICCMLSKLDNTDSVNDFLCKQIQPKCQSTITWAVHEIGWAFSPADLLMFIPSSAGSPAYTLVGQAIAHMQTHRSLSSRRKKTSSALPNKILWLRQGQEVKLRLHDSPQRLHSLSATNLWLWESKNVSYACNIVIWVMFSFGN